MIAVGLVTGLQFTPAAIGSSLFVLHAAHTRPFRRPDSIGSVPRGGMSDTSMVANVERWASDVIMMVLVSWVRHICRFHVLTPCQWSSSRTRWERTGSTVLRCIP